MGDSIFEFADEFGIDSPFGNWENMDFKQISIYGSKIVEILIENAPSPLYNLNPKNKIPIYFNVTVKIIGEENVLIDILCDGGAVPVGSIQILNKNRNEFTGELSYEAKSTFYISVDKNTFQPYNLMVYAQLKKMGDIIDKMQKKINIDSKGRIIIIENNNLISSQSIIKLTEDQLQSISPNIKMENIKKHLDGINQSIADNNIDTCLRVSNFLAQVLHESGGLRYTKEIGVSDSKYGGYIGRGLIQITGESNYVKYQDFSGEDVTSSLENKKKLENPPHAAKSSGWYWDTTNLNPLADKNDLIMITRNVNGGFNGFDNRLVYLQGALKAICNIQIEILNFNSSKAYFDKRASFAWGLWHDPGINKVGCKKNADISLEGYQRFIDLIPTDFKDFNWYEIKSISAFNGIKELNLSVNVKKAAELRIKELKK